MTILLWYFPFVIFSGVCDLVYSTRENHPKVGSSKTGIPNDVVGKSDMVGN
jgi:hypothetical protein